MKVTGRHVFIGDNCRSHRVKVAAICFRLEPVPVYALLWVIIAGCVLVGARAHVFAFALVCECLCMCVDVFMRTQSYRGLSPTRLPLLFLFCFVFLLSLQETNTGSLCPLLDLPSVPGDQVGGQMLCRNARPSSGSWASVLSHC